MVHWTKVISGFDAEDETVNFGARTVAEQDGSIYETWTRATIQCDKPEELQQALHDHQTPQVHPSVKAAFCHSLLCIVVDNSITIFADESCQEILTSIGFESLVTSYCLSSTGELLFAAIENGLIHCFNISLGSKQIFSIDINEFNCNTVVHLSLEENSPTMDLIISTTSGKILKLSGINESLDETITEDLNKIQVLTNISKISSAADVLTYSSHKSIITLGEEVFLYPRNISCPLKSLTYRYKKVQFFNNYGAILGLRTDGSLSLICKLTLLSKKIYPGPIEDFITVQEKTDDHHMLVLMKPKDHEDTTSLHLMSFPDFQIKFSMIVPRSCYLVELNSIVDHLIFLEGVKNPQGLIDTIRIKAIEESSPEFRLQRLLRRQKFQEAREFSKKFGLDEEIVFHAEAKMLMERLQPSVHVEEFVDVEVFLETLEKIKDVEFVYECCKNAMTRNYKETRRLIVYSRRRIVDFMNSQDKNQGHDVLVKLLSHVSDSLRKLETFEVIHTGEFGPENIEEWNRFSTANLFEECVKHLSLGELDAAALIWIRHTPTISPQMTTSSITHLLNSIPETLAPSDLWPWLRHFVPSATALIPTSLPCILHWALKKIKSLEIYHRDLWPGIGLSFANGLISMLQFEEYNVCFQFHQQYATKDSNLQRLQQLIQAMSDLLDLKTRYKIMIPLRTYMGDPTEVIHLLLNKIHIDEIPALMSNFLQQYMLNHSLKNDQVLSSYINKTLKKSKGWWIWDKAPWEKRLSVIIGHIHNVQNRLQQTLEVLKKAPVPWSSAVSTLADESYQYDHPLVSQIRIESSSVAVKLIMKKYGFAHVGLSSNLYNSIIKEDRGSMIEDLLELTKNKPEVKHKVFAICLNHHLRTGDVDKVMKIMEMLDEDVGNFCCKQIVNDFQGRLNNFGDFKDDSLVYYADILGSIERKLDKKGGNDDTLEMIPHLRCIYLLKTEFNMSINVRDYFQDKKQILLGFISNLIENREVNSENIQSLERVSELLSLPRLSGIYEYFEATKNTEILQTFLINRMSNWEVLTSEECQFSLKICSELVLKREDNAILAKSLKTLISRTLTNCSPDILPDVVQCSIKIDAYNEAVSNTLELQESSIYPIYKDASISAGDVLVPYLNNLFTLSNFYENNCSSDTHTNEEIMIMKRDLPLMTRSLMNEHYDYAVMKILMSIYMKMSTFLPKYEETISEIRSVLNTCNSMMLKKVVDSIVFDIQLGLTCLFTLTQDNALKLLNICGQLYESDQRRDRLIKELSYEYFRLTENYNQMDKFKSTRMLHHWAKRLAHCGVSYREVLASSIEDRRNILKRIMMSKKPETLDILKDFCSNFGFIFTDCCLSYLEILLTTWEPEFTVSSPQEGSRYVRINENQVRVLIVECKRVAAEIEDKSSMKTYLTDALKIPLFNFYYYEVFLIALELAEMNNKIEWISHLCFLQNYTRVAGPTELETDAWLNCSQEPQLPPIAQWRLPFLPRADFFKLITPELNLKTYQKWLSIAPVLNISIPNICTLSVRNSTDDAWRSSRGISTTWSINSLNSTLLKDIKKCLECMKDVDRLKYGTASLYYVVNHTPPGADLVAAAKECFLYMEQLKEMCGDEADPANKFSKIKDKYVMNTSKHILHTHGLGVSKYISLVDRHEELIVELYKDESIPKRYRSATKHRPDINSAVDALGEVLPINVGKIRGDLLKEWLQPEAPEKNDSITAVFREDHGSSESDIFSTDDNLLRACYVVSSGKTEAFIHYLVHISFDEKENYNPGMRFRALRVIQSLTDAATLESYTKINAEQFHQHMKSLQYLTELQRLGIGYSVNGFESCSKGKLVQVLVNSQFEVARALGLIPQIFLDFGLEDFEVLDIALGRMVKMGLVRELKRSLMMLAGADRLVNYKGYVAAWQLVVSDGFGRLEAGVSGEGLEGCVEALRMLHACPVVDKLEFGEMVGVCLKGGQMQFAGALLQFLGEEERKGVVERIVREGEVESVIEGLRELGGKGILGVRQSVVVLERAKEGLLKGEIKGLRG